ncbi:MAG: hypothetical protein L6R00_06850 [Phycisphaerae bacterium]|nr:hypothetical protein [Phycisphaerae bacterium]
MSEATQSCEQCGATIYPEHIAKKKAGRVGGKLLCPSCVAEKIREHQASGKQGASASGVIASAPVAAAATSGQRAGAQAVGGGSGLIRPAGASGTSGTIAPPKEETEEPLSLVSDEEMAADKGASIRSFNVSSLAQADRHENFKRGLVDAAMGATRCRTFHAKLTDAALSYMDNQINEWIDAHRDFHIKFAVGTIGMFEAKQHQEPHLIVNVFY